MVNNPAYYTPNCNRTCPVKLTLSKAQDLFHTLTQLPKSLLKPETEYSYPEPWMKSYRAEAGAFTYRLSTEHNGWYTAFSIENSNGMMREYYFTADSSLALQKSWLYKDEITEEIKGIDDEPSIHLKNSQRAAQEELCIHINSYFQGGSQKPDPQLGDALAP